MVHTNPLGIEVSRLPHVRVAFLTLKLLADINAYTHRKENLIQSVFQFCRPLLVTYSTLSINWHKSRKASQF